MKEPPNSFEAFRILDYRASLEVTDRASGSGVFSRRQSLLVTGDRIGFVIDRVWGDGVVLANYSVVGAEISTMVRTPAGYAIILQLPRMSRRGDRLHIQTRRKIVGAFNETESYWELSLPTETDRFEFALVGPPGDEIRSPRISAPSFAGLNATETRRRIFIHATNPSPYIPYRLDWSW